jgi:transcriptional regulator with XRE-family HTH domain
MADAIGRRIRRLREQRGLSLRALAKEAGVAVSAIAAVEVGTRSGDRLSAQTCRRLARALGVTIDYLVGVYENDDDPAPVRLAAVG